MYTLYPISTPDDRPLSEIPGGIADAASRMWTYGSDPTGLQLNLSHDPLVIFLMLILITAGMFNFTFCRKVFKSPAHDLWGIRERENVFDEAPSFEARTFMILIFQLIVSESLLLYLWFSSSGYHAATYSDMNITLGMLAALSAGYYLFQLGAYSVVGWTFADATGCRMWLRGFVVSTGILGLVLPIPVIVAMFYPETSVIMTATGAIFFIISKIFFILKGYRIFFHNFFSLVYFILYLCALEIIPVILVYVQAYGLCMT